MFSIPVTPAYRKLYNTVAIEAVDGQRMLVLGDFPLRIEYPLTAEKHSVVFLLSEELWKAIDNGSTTKFLGNFFKAHAGTTLEKEWSDLETRCGVTELAVLTEQWKMGFKFDFTSDLTTLHTALQKAMGELGYHKAFSGTRVDLPIIPASSDQAALLAVLAMPMDPESTERFRDSMVKAMSNHVAATGAKVDEVSLRLVSKAIDVKLIQDMVTAQKTPDANFNYTTRLLANIQELLKTDEFKNVGPEVLATVAEIEKSLVVGSAKEVMPGSETPAATPTSSPAEPVVATPVPQTPPATPVVLKGLEIAKLTDEKIQSIREFALGQFFKKARLAKLPGAVRELFMQYMTKERVEASFNAAEGSMPDAVAMLALMVIMAFKQNEETGVALRRMGVWDNVAHAEKFLLGEETAVVPDVGPQQPHGVSSLTQAGQTIANTQVTRAPKVIV